MFKCQEVLPLKTKLFSFQARYDAHITRTKNKKELRAQNITEGEQCKAEDNKYDRSAYFNGPHPVMDNNQLQVKISYIIHLKLYYIKILFSFIHHCQDNVSNENSIR